MTLSLSLWTLNVKKPNPWMTNALLAAGRMPEIPPFSGEIGQVEFAADSPPLGSSRSEVRSPTRTSTEVRSPTRTSTEVRSPTSTSTEVRSPTSTSTEAYTQGNFTSTVTGGAGAGSTSVHIHLPGHLPAAQTRIRTPKSPGVFDHISAPRPANTGIFDNVGPSHSDYGSFSGDYTPVLTELLAFQGRRSNPTLDAVMKNSDAFLRNPKLQNITPNSSYARPTVPGSTFPDGKLSSKQLDSLWFHHIIYDGKTFRKWVPGAQKGALLEVYPHSRIWRDVMNIYNSDLRWIKSQDEHHLHTGGLFSKVGRMLAPKNKALSNIAKRADDKGVLSVAVSSVADMPNAITRVPVLGPALEAVYKVSVGSITFPIEVAANVASGKRIDRAIYEPFKEQIKSVQEVIPYVQMVLSVIPGIGQGISAVLGAANALTKGMPITDALLEGAKGAIPGGPAAVAAFDIGIAAMQGKPIDEVLLNALPLPQSAKEAIIKGVKVAKDIVNGKNVAESAFNQGLSYLPDEAQTALKTGMAIAQGKNLQEIAKQAAPAAAPAFAALGVNRIASNPVLKAGSDILKSNPAAKKGYEIGLGFMGHKITPVALVALRKSLPIAQKNGFDIAVSAHVGSVGTPVKANVPTKVKFGYVVTQGMRGASVPQKKAMMKSIAKDTDARKGATKAISIQQPSFILWVKKLFIRLGKP